MGKVFQGLGLFVWLVMATGPGSAFANILTGDLGCEERLLLMQRAQEKLNYEPKIEVKELDPYDDIKSAHSYRITAKNPAWGTELALLDFTVYDQGTSIRVDKIEVLNPNNRGKGLSNLLFLHMREHSPQATRIIVSLAMDNLKKIEDALRKTDNCAEAFKETPFYKSAAHFGFTKIRAACDLGVHVYSFILEVEPAH